MKAMLADNNIWIRNKKFFITHGPNDKDNGLCFYLAFIFIVIIAIVIKHIDDLREGKARIVFRHSDGRDK